MNSVLGRFGGLISDDQADGVVAQAIWAMTRGGTSRRGAVVYLMRTGRISRISPL